MATFIGLKQEVKVCFVVTNEAANVFLALDPEFRNFKSSYAMTAVNVGVAYQFGTAEEARGWLDKLRAAGGNLFSRVAMISTETTVKREFKFVEEAKL